MNREIQKFDVGLKAFIERDGKVLVMRESIGGLWEVPGGRIDVGEEKLGLHEILQREILEELGPSLTVSIGQPFTSWIRVWTPPKSGYVYLTGFRCPYIKGEIQISDEHSEMRWISPADIDTLDFAPGFKVAIKKFWESKTHAVVV